MKTTPLYHRHLELGAQMTEFAGYQMPVRYAGDKLEHMAVRQSAGMFDVSHMGEVWVTGPKAEQDMMRLLTQDASKQAPGRAFYALMLTEKGGTVDDVIAYKFSPEKYLICVNASNREKDFNWIQAHCEAQVVDASDEWSQIAIQGPAVTKSPLSPLLQRGAEIKRFGFAQIGDFIIARTGYTGEDGFEIFVPNAQAVKLWDELLEEATPCGLAARDTLRLEAGMCLYGHELSEEITPLEAGLNWCVKLERKPFFIGQEALRPPTRRLVGLVMQGSGIARQDYEVCTGTGEKIGLVTSGTKTPYLNRAIAMAYVSRPHCELGEDVYVKVRGRLEPAKVVQLPFYRRKT